MKVRQIIFTAITALISIGSFASSAGQVLAVTGGGTATIARDGGAQGAGVTVVQGTSHVFTTVLTVPLAGMTLGAASPTFTIPTGFTAPNTQAVATSGLVLADGNWSVVGSGGTCVVDSSPVSSTTVASGQLITVDVIADCAAGNTITLTYRGTSAIAMGATALTIRTADAGDPGPVTPLIAGSPTITVTAAPASATLTVINQVINNNGGTASANAWTMTVSSSNGGSGTGSAAGTGSGTVYTLQTGSQYSVSASGGPSGYNASLSSECVIASAVGSTSYTCVITNDDIASTGSTASSPNSSSSNSSSTGGGSGSCTAPIITTVPILLESRRVSPTSIFISWGPGAGIENFNVQYGLKNGAWSWNTNVTGFSTTLNALPENQPIWVRVAARNNCAIGTYGEAKIIGGPLLPNAGFAPPDHTILGYITSAYLFLLHVLSK